MFVTIWLGVLEISTGRIVCVNAGHEDPAVYRKDGAFDLIKSKHNLVVGAMPDVTYTDLEIRLEKGDKIFLYTDGVTEAADPEDRLFSTDRMIDALNEHREETPQEILEGIHRSVKAFARGRTQYDDLTMLCLELKG